MQTTHVLPFHHHTQIDVWYLLWDAHHNSYDQIQLGSAMLYLS